MVRPPARAASLPPRGPPCRRTRREQRPEATSPSWPASSLTCLSGSRPGIGARDATSIGGHDDVSLRSGPVTREARRGRSAAPRPVRPRSTRARRRLRRRRTCRCSSARRARGEPSPSSLSVACRRAHPRLREHDGAPAPDHAHAHLDAAGAREVARGPSQPTSPITARRGSAASRERLRAPPPVSGNDPAAEVLHVGGGPGGFRRAAVRTRSRPTTFVRASPW
jgi:hypothetical protein